MGMFNFKKGKKQPKVYTLAEAMELVAKNSKLEPVPLTDDVIRGPYTVVEAEERREELETLKAEVRKNSNFKERKDEFMKEIHGNGEYEKIPYDIGMSHSDRPGRVIRDYTL